MPSPSYQIPDNVLVSKQRFDDTQWQPNGGWPDRYTVRDCAFVNDEPHQGSHGGGLNTMLPDAGEIGVFERCYFGGAAGQQMMWLRPSFSGLLVFKDCLFEDFGADAIYCDPCGRPSDGGGGRVIIDGCVARNNNISQIRLPVGSEMYDSYIYNTGSVPPNEMGQINSRGGHTYYDQTGGTVQVHNTHIDVGSHNTNGAAAAVDNDASGCEWVLTDCEIRGGLNGAVTTNNCGSNPDRTVPAGVPETPAQALAGGGGGGSGDGGTTAPEPTGTRFDLTTAAGAPLLSYEFEVAGSVRKAAATKPTSEGNDSVTTNSDGTTTVAGKAGNGYGDGYWVEGTITSLNLNGNGDQWTLHWDGSETTKTALVGDASGGGGSSPTTHTLVLSGTGEKMTYSLDVTGDSLTFSDASGATVNPEDSIDGQTATGAVFGGTDAYDFTGDLASLTVDGGYDTITLDGTEIDPANYGSSGGSDSGSGSGRSGRSPDVTRPADGSTVVFELSHSLGSVPAGVSVEPATAAASSDYWVSDVTDSYVEVTYANPPAADAALAWYLSVE